VEDVAGKPIDEVFTGSCMTPMDSLRSVASILTGHIALSGFGMSPTIRPGESLVKKEGILW